MIVVWTIKRVMNVETWDFDYLRDLDRAEVNKKKMDDGTYTMVYCIWNKKLKKYLRNDFKTSDGDDNCLNFCDSFSPIKCGWMIQRIEGTANQYSLFSMSNYSNRNDAVAETLMSLVTLDPIGPIYKAAREASQFPFNQEFITPIFSSFSSNNHVHMEQFPNKENSWCIVPADHIGITNFYAEEDVFDSNNLKSDYEKNLDYNKIRITCSDDVYCKNVDILKTGDWYKRGKCEERMCDSVLKDVFLLENI